MQTTTLITQISSTPSNSIIALLQICVLIKSRITLVFVSLLELGPIPNYKQIITIARIVLIQGPRFLALSVSLLR